MRTRASRVGRRGNGARGRGCSAAVVAAVVLFALGVALGLALDDRPVPGGTQTSLRTLPPLPQTSP